MTCSLRRFAPLALIAATALLVAGCQGAGGPDQPQPNQPAPEEVELLTCDDLAEPAEIENVLTFADGSAPQITDAVRPDISLDPFLVPEAGGLSCAWRNGPEPTQPDWVEPGAAYAGVDVLPGAGAFFTDGLSDPVEPSVTIAGVDSVSVCDGGGCLVAGVVGDAWVRAWMDTSAFETQESVYAGLDDRAAEVLERLAAVAEHAYATIEEAPAEAYAWEARGDAEAVTCEELSGHAGAPAETWGYGGPAEEGDAATPQDAESFSQAVWHMLDGTTCRWEGANETEEFVSVVPGAAEVVDRLAETPDQNVLFEPYELAGADTATRWCYEPGYCVIHFTAGGHAFDTGSPELAEKIAQGMS